MQSVPPTPLAEILWPSPAPTPPTALCGTVETAAFLGLEGVLSGMMMNHEQQQVDTDHTLCSLTSPPSWKMHTQCTCAQPRLASSVIAALCSRVPPAVAASPIAVQM